MIAALRFPSFDEDMTLPFICTAYLGHPPNVDASGPGTARSILATLQDIGLTNANIRAQLKGAAYDGAFMGTKVI